MNSNDMPVVIRLRSHRVGSLPYPIRDDTNKKFFFIRYNHWSRTWLYWGWKPSLNWL
jgi:hypothetical protein